MEHHSNFVPWQVLAKETGAVLRFVDIDDEGRLRDNWHDLIGEKTRLVAVTQMSNALGTINPVREIAEVAHAYGALVLVDGAQSVAHMPVDVQDIDCDFLAFSGHKMLGPTGVGVLYGRREVLEDMTPFLTGGHMISRVSLEGTTWNELPWRLEAGTPNIADVIAYGAAIDYLEGIGMDDGPPARYRANGLRPGRAIPGAGSEAVRPCAMPTTAAAPSPSTTANCTRTTWALSLTSTGSPSAPATTARSL